MKETAEVFALLACAAACTAALIYRTLPTPEEQFVQTFISYTNQYAYRRKKDIVETARIEQVTQEHAADFRAYWYPHYTHTFNIISSYTQSIDGRKQFTKDDCTKATDLLKTATTIFSIARQYDQKIKDGQISGQPFMSDDLYTQRKMILGNFGLYLNLSCKP